MRHLLSFGKINHSLKNLFIMLSVRLHLAFARVASLVPVILGQFSPHPPLVPLHIPDFVNPCIYCFKLLSVLHFFDKNHTLIFQSPHTCKARGLVATIRRKTRWPFTVIVHEEQDLRLSSKWVTFKRKYFYHAGLNYRVLTFWRETSHLRCAVFWVSIFLPLHRSLFSEAFW